MSSYTLEQKCEALEMAIKTMHNYRFAESTKPYSYWVKLHEQSIAILEAMKEEIKDE